MSIRLFSYYYCEFFFIWVEYVQFMFTLQYFDSVIDHLIVTLLKLLESFLYNFVLVLRLSLYQGDFINLLKSDNAFLFCKVFWYSHCDVELSGKSDDSTKPLSVMPISYFSFSFFLSLHIRISLAPGLLLCLIQPRTFCLLSKPNIFSKITNFLIFLSIIANIFSFLQGYMPEILFQS